MDSRDLCRKTRGGEHIPQAATYWGHGPRHPHIYGRVLYGGEGTEGLHSISELASTAGHVPPSKQWGDGLQIVPRLVVR